MDNAFYIKGEKIMPINDCHYDKIKVLYELCKISHFIKKHGLSDAQKNNDKEFQKLLIELEKTVDSFSTQLNNLIIS